MPSIFKESQAGTGLKGDRLSSSQSIGRQVEQTNHTGTGKEFPYSEVHQVLDSMLTPGGTLPDPEGPRPVGTLLVHASLP